MHDNSENLVKICDLIKACNSDTDSIVLAMKLKQITKRVSDTIRDEKSLNELFEHFNKAALSEGDNFIDCLILVVTAKQLDGLTVDGKVFRYSLMTICQKNHQNSDNYKKESLSKFYNSLKLLGAVFNKLRTAQGQTYNILGQSLLKMLNLEMEKELKNVVHFKTDDFAKLILSQITLNGNLLKSRHSHDIDRVLFSVRKCLIEIDCLSSKSRAFLLMTLDLYYKNFGSLGEALESMYKEFLVDEFTTTNQTQPPQQSTTEVPVEVKTDKVKVQDSLEKLKITKAPQRKQQPYQPQSPHKSPRSPLPQVTSPTPSVRRNPIPLRSSNKIAQPNRPQSQPQPHQRDIAPKKPSPQSLRQRNSSSSHQSDHRSNSPSRKPQRSHFERSPRRNESPVASSYQRNRRSYTPNRQQNHYQSTNGNSNAGNRSRVSQPNSHNSSPQEKPRSEPTTPLKYKNQEIPKFSPPIENFSWASDGELDDLDKSASPKVHNPYTNSFLNFLAGGQ